MFVPSDAPSVLPEGGNESGAGLAADLSVEEKAAPKAHARQASGKKELGASAIAAAPVAKGKDRRGKPTGNWPGKGQTRGQPSVVLGWREVSGNFQPDSMEKDLEKGK